MFDRLTARTRRVLVLAQDEARQLNHAYIGTEHLLLGLVAEGEGVAACALQRLGITADAVRRGVESTVSPGKTEPAGLIPFTVRAKQVIEFSLREAHEFDHEYVGTEHLLLGLLREGSGVAGQVLARLGADLDATRAEVVEILGRRDA